jgi:hypothetical protein
MTRPSEDDRAAVDRAFAEMVAGYHLTAERRVEAPAEQLPPVEPDAQPATSEQPAEAARSGEPDPHWADEHPLFHFVDPAPAVSPPEKVEPEQPRYVPDPLPPLPAPAVPAVIGWFGIAWAALVVLAAAFGLRFPSWVGWLAVLGFVGGFVILVTRLPRHRSPDAGDGAVL